MSIEILSIDLNDATIEKLADAVARRLGSQTVTQSNPPSAETPSGGNAGLQPGVADPWGTTQPQQQPVQQPAQQPSAAGPSCAHGPMRFVPAGFSKSTGKAYQAFWGCPASRGQAQCRSVKAA